MNNSSYNPNTYDSLYDLAVAHNQRLVQPTLIDYTVQTAKDSIEQIKRGELDNGTKSRNITGDTIRRWARSASRWYHLNGQDEERVTNTLLKHYNKT